MASVSCCLGPRWEPENDNFYENRKYQGCAGFQKNWSIYVASQKDWLLSGSRLFSFKLSAWWCCSQVCLTDLAVVSEALQLPLQRWVEILSSVLHWTPPKPCQHTTEWHLRWKHIDANNLKFTQIKGLGLWVTHTSSECRNRWWCFLWLARCRLFT